MAAFAKQATNYFVALYPQSGGSGRIVFYCADGYKLHVVFTNGAPPANTFDAGSKTGVAHVQLAQLPYYVDVARNEKPVNVTFNPDVTPPAYVVHAHEPVGEGDI